MRQKLFTKQIDDMLFKQYAMGNDLSKQKVVAKIFNPYGRGVWYLLNSDPQDPDYIWAIVDLFEPEVGSVSREDLETIKVPPFGLNLERDIYFQPMNAQDLLNRVMQGERFADGGATDLQIVKSDTQENYLTTQDASPSEYAVKLGNGGVMDKSDLEGLIGLNFQLDLEGGGESSEHKIVDVRVTPTNFSHRDITLITNDGSEDKIPFEKLDAFLNNDQVDLKDSQGEAYAITLIDLFEPKVVRTQFEEEEFEYGNGGELKDIEKDAIKLSKTHGKIYLLQRQGGGEEGKYVLATEEDLMDELNSKYNSRFIQLYGNGKKYADGGKIKDQYEGRKPEDVWNNLSKEQRSHFIYDHEHQIEEYRGDEHGELSGKEIIKAYNSDYSELDKNIKNRFDNHVREGQYGDGGTTNQDYNVTINYPSDNPKSGWASFDHVDIKVTATSRDSAKAKALKEFKKLHPNKNGTIGNVNNMKPSDFDMIVNKKFADGGMMGMGGEKAEFGSLLIGAGIGVAGKYLYDNYNKSESKSESKKTMSQDEDEDEITTWKKYVDKDGYESVFGDGESKFTQKDISDTQLRNLANEYKKNYKELNAYIPNSNISDDDKDELTYRFDKEGYDYALDGYSDWKEIKDSKFQTLRKQHNSLVNKLDKFFEFSYAKGGTTTFNDKVTSISKSLMKRKKVAPKVQKDYGKTYSKDEAIDSAKRIAGAMRKKGMAKKKS